MASDWSLDDVRRWTWWMLRVLGRRRRLFRLVRCFGGLWRLRLMRGVRRRMVSLLLFRVRVLIWCVMLLVLMVSVLSCCVVMFILRLIS